MRQCSELRADNYSKIQTELFQLLFQHIKNDLKIFEDPTTVKIVTPIVTNHMLHKGIKEI